MNILIRRERLILCVDRYGFYLSIRPFRRYYRLAIGDKIFGLIYVGRS